MQRPQTHEVGDQLRFDEPDDVGTHAGAHGLVPDRDDVQEIHRLDTVDQQQLMRESVLLSRSLDAVFRPDRLNIAALGNIVPQLHVHHVVRYRQDAAWPAPVWGRVPAHPYDEAGLASLLPKPCM